MVASRSNVSYLDDAGVARVACPERQTAVSPPVSAMPDMERAKIASFSGSPRSVISGTIWVSVCSDANCVMDKQDLEVDVDVE